MHQDRFVGIGSGREQFEVCRHRARDPRGKFPKLWVDVPIRLHEHGAANRRTLEGDPRREADVRPDLQIRLGIRRVFAQEVDVTSLRATEDVARLTGSVVVHRRIEGVQCLLCEIVGAVEQPTRTAPLVVEETLATPKSAPILLEFVEVESRRCNR